jgi:hypothetical protein
VAEEFLDDAEVGAEGEEVAGEGVAEHVGVDVALDAGFRGGLAEDAVDAFAGEGPAAMGDEDLRDGAGLEELGADLLEVALDLVLGRDADGD